jgi:hypothetical protein
MKKINKISSKNLKNIVKNRFLDENSLPEHKIDSIIREYLNERDDYLDEDDYLGDKYEFSPKSNEALTDMVDGLTEMLDDLEIIKEKEGDVLVLTDVYADEYLNGVIRDLQDVMDDLKYLAELKSSEDML